MPRRWIPRGFVGLVLPPRTVAAFFFLGRPGPLLLVASTSPACRPSPCLHSTPATGVPRPPSAPLLHGFGLLPARHVAPEPRAACWRERLDQSELLCRLRNLLPVMLGEGQGFASGNQDRRWALRL